MDKRIYHKEKCQSTVRRVITLDTGLVPVTIIVAGKHAFNWSVTLVRLGIEKSLICSGRPEALKELQRLKTQYRLVGDCKLAV